MEVVRVIYKYKLLLTSDKIYTNVKHIESCLCSYFLLFFTHFLIYIFYGFTANYNKRCNIKIVIELCNVLKSSCWKNIFLKKQQLIGCTTYIFSCILPSFKEAILSRTILELHLNSRSNSMVHLNLISYICRFIFLQMLIYQHVCKLNMIAIFVKYV